MFVESASSCPCAIDSDRLGATPFPPDVQSDLGDVEGVLADGSHFDVLVRCRSATSDFQRTATLAIDSSGPDKQVTVRCQLAP